MGKFKLNAPYKLDPIPRYEVPFSQTIQKTILGLLLKLIKMEL
tara:strand:+ start:587 stop:715 length:129 start_codon:yes stop_codon:yes gene_type:complete